MLKTELTPRQTFASAGPLSDTQALLRLIDYAQREAERVGRPECARYLAAAHEALSADDDDVTFLKSLPVQIRTQDVV